MGQTVFCGFAEFYSELFSPKMQEKVLKSYDFRTFYGCGGRTRTYDLRVMSCRQDENPLLSGAFRHFYVHFSGNPEGQKSIWCYLVHCLISPYGSKHGSDAITLQVLDIRRQQVASLAYPVDRVVPFPTQFLRPLPGNSQNTYTPKQNDHEPFRLS